MAPRKLVVSSRFLRYVSKGDQPTAKRAWTADFMG